MTIIDYVILGVAGVALILGLIKGFSGFLKGFLSVLLALGIALALTMPLAQALPSAQDSLAEVISEKISTDPESIFNQKMYRAVNTETEADELYVIVTSGETETVLSFSDAMQKTGDGVVQTILEVASKPIENAILTNLSVGEGKENAELVSKYVSQILAKILLRIIMFFALFIVSIIILKILGTFIEKVIEDRTGLKIIDKFIGVVICLGIVLGIVLGVSILGYTYLGTENAIVKYLDQSTIVSKLMDMKWVQSLLEGVTAKLPAGKTQSTEEAVQPETVEEAQTCISSVVHSLSAVVQGILPPKL